MNITKFSLGLSLTAALCLMACGDDSGSSADPDDTPELSSSSEGSSDPESSSEKAKSSSSAEQVSSSSVKEAEPCTFVADDNAWEISYKVDDGKGSGTAKSIYEIDGEDLVIRDSIRYTGTQASMICRIANGPSELSSRDGNFEGTQSCDGGSAVLLVTTVRQKGFFAANDREAVHAAVKKACNVAVNGGTYDAVPLATKTVCDFKVEDDVWAYTYLDKDWHDKDSVIVHQTFLFESQDLVKAEPVCNANYGSQVARVLNVIKCRLMDVSASGLRDEKASIYERELKACKDKMPAVEPDTSVTDTTTTTPDTTTAPAGEMVSCDIPGVLGECLEFPAGSDEAAGLTEQCVSVLEGTLGTGCAK